MSTTASAHRRARYFWLVVLALVFALSACGGGGGDGVGSGGTGSYAAGPISGFGSVIVNGIRYDDDGAEVLDEDGNSVGSDALRLGMVVEITGSALTSTPNGSTATASTIRFASEMKGPVEEIDVPGNVLRVLGQTVGVTQTTAFEAGLEGRLTVIAVGDVLEIHALGNGAGRYIATRIEREDDANEYRLRGPIEDLNASVQTFRIGATLISYAGAEAPVPALADGRIVRVRLQTMPVAGAYEATRVRLAGRRIDDRDEAEVEGLVSSVEPGGLRFTVEGLAVDAATAEFDDGTPADVQVGRRVEVEGRIEAGVLIARKVELEDDGGGDDDDDDGGIELEGLIESLDVSGGTFVLRGLTVAFGDATTFEGGTVADLEGDAVRIEVDGRMAADGVTVEALRIEFDD